MLRKFLVSIYAFWCISGQAQDLGQSVLNNDVSIDFSNVSLSAALRQLNRQAGISFSYNNNIIPKGEKFSASYENVSLRTILEEILSDANLYYREIGSTVVILKRETTDRVIKGRVIDAETDGALPYANVFIDNSTLGVATDKNGYFEVKDVPDIAFNLVVSYVGYTSKIIPFTQKQELESHSTFIVEMDTEEIDLAPVQVLAKKTARQRRRDRRLYRRFEEDFLGRDSNAKDCKIINPEVLDFLVIDSLENYEVIASDVIYIENAALGYRLEYFLDEYSFINGVKTTIGKAQFMEMEPRSKKQNRQWEEARAKAYYGSVNHFLNSLIEGTLRGEGFMVNTVQFDSVTSEYSTPLNPLPASEIISLEETGKEFEYRLNVISDIEITYTKAYEDEDYKKLFRSKSKTGNYKYTDQKSRSTISLSNDQSLSSYQVVGMDISDVPLFQKSVILFQADDPLVAYPGYFSSKRAALYLGWWTWGGVSVKLPLNYKPTVEDVP